MIQYKADHFKHPTKWKGFGKWFSCAWEVYFRPKLCLNSEWFVLGRVWDRKRPRAWTVVYTYLSLNCVFKIVLEMCFAHFLRSNCLGSDLPLALEQCFTQSGSNRRLRCAWKLSLNCVSPDLCLNSDSTGCLNCDFLNTRIIDLDPSGLGQCLTQEKVCETQFKPTDATGLVFIRGCSELSAKTLHFSSVFFRNKPRKKGRWGHLCNSKMQVSVSFTYRSKKIPWKSIEINSKIDYKKCIYERSYSDCSASARSQITFWPRRNAVFILFLIAFILLNTKVDQNYFSFKIWRSQCFFQLLFNYLLSVALFIIV
jgi:hypothetical protein